MCWMRLPPFCFHKLTLDFIIRILLGHSGSLLCKSPKVSTVSNLEFNIASVSASSVLNDSSFNVFLTKCASHKNLLCDWMLVGFCVKRCNLHQLIEENTESSDDPFFESISEFFLRSHKIGPIATMQNLDVPSSGYKSLQSLYEQICIYTACTFNMYCPASQTCEECPISLKFLSILFYQK